MHVVDVKIIRKGDPEPWAEDVNYRCAGPESPIDVLFLEGGMVSGAPSVLIRFALADGTYAAVETSLALWIAATAAARGAFPEAFAGGPLAAT